jgi:hypothetical protein
MTVGTDTIPNAGPAGEQAASRGVGLDSTSSVGVPARSTTGRLSLLAASTAVALGVSVALNEWLLVGRGLRAETDVVGYPTVNDFDVHHYTQLFLLGAAVFPVVLTATYVVFDRFLPRLVGRIGDRRLVEVTGVAGRLALPGAVAGLTVALAAGASGGTVWPLVGAGIVGYGVAAVGAAALVGLRPPRRTIARRLALVNAAAAPLSLLALAVASSATEVTVVESGRVQQYPFVSPALVAAATLVAAAAVLTIVRRHAQETLENVRRLEFATVATFAGSVLVYLITARLPGELGPLDAFHEGETLATAAALRRGAFPWRDVLFIHGPLMDGLWPRLGLAIFGDTRWAEHAGRDMVTMPLCMVLVWLLLVGVLRRNWVVLAGFVVIVAAGSEFFSGLLTTNFGGRFLLLPVIVLMLAQTLRAARTLACAAWGAALGGLMLAAFALTPEMGFAVVAVGVVLVGAEWAGGRGSGVAVPARFPRTLGCLAGGLGVAVAFVAWLALNGALDDFLFYFRTFAPDHALTGGVPAGEVEDDLFGYLFAAALPWVLALITAAYVAWRLARRASIRAEEWALTSLAVLGILYYPKFLSRADLHVLAGVAIGLPLLVYVVARLLEPGDREVAAAAPQRSPRHLVSSIVVLSVLIVALPAAVDRVEAVPVSFAPAVASEPTIERLGYASTNALAPGVLVDLQVALDAVGPGSRLFDFTNQPAIVHYLLGLAPPTRYPHVSMAIRRPNQADLIEQLAADPPELALYWTGSYGSPAWDGILNPVRHYDVSQWLLERYEPWISVNDEVLYLRNDLDPPDPATYAGRLSAPAITDDPMATFPECRWGTAPMFLSDDDRAGTGREPLVAAAIVEVATLTGRVPEPAGTEAVLAVSPSGRVVGEADASTPRPGPTEVPDDARFDLVVPLAEGEVVGDVRVLAVDAAGRAVPVGDGPTLAPGTPVPFSSGRTATVADAPAVGAVDSVVSGPARGEQVVRLDLPPGATERADWVELAEAGKPRRDEYRLSDVYGGPINRSIMFRTTGRPVDRYLVQAASCPQWHEFTGGTLYLRHQDDVPTTVSLQRSLDPPGGA